MRDLNHQLNHPLPPQQPPRARPEKAGADAYRDFLGNRTISQGTCA